jgi:quinol monooxygenase YgiN
MYPLIAKWTILPGNEKKAVAALKKLAKDVKQQEPGTLLYMVHVPNFKEKSLPTPPAGEVVFFEIYKDQAAFLKHVGGSIFTNFVKQYGKLFLNDFSATPQVYMSTEVLTQLAGFARSSLSK